MKSNIISLGVLSCLFAAGAANAADGTISFTGSVVAAACTVSTQTAAQTVNLGTINSSGFTSAGTVAGATRFDITLASCPSTITKTSVKFDGTPDATDSRLLALTSGQTATGLGIAIYESNGTTLIPMQTASASKDLEADATSTTMTFIAKYMSTAANVGAGTASASTSFTIAYN
ncbi:ferrous iron transporter B [Pseudomonas fluorescens HK44]|uniref:Ferrous iron transporter B n=1 Tax=Pseudomonas fluorescens HK44 TaxID=1042209 RepID=A0A010SXX2_PSEFL|nr:fimbrial protein [Pseudomonas fluorescens]EXF95613.1 ferrous iron transporter B [Pseudomonas fluorescens HK44]